jgi:hypothetical protein
VTWHRIIGERAPKKKQARSLMLKVFLFKFIQRIISLTDRYDELMNGTQV